MLAFYIVACSPAIFISSNNPSSFAVSKLFFPSIYLDVPEFGAVWVISNTVLVWPWSASLLLLWAGLEAGKEGWRGSWKVGDISAAILKERQDTMIKLQKLCSKYSRAPVWNLFEAKFSCPSSEVTLCSSVCFDCAKEKLQEMQIMAFWMLDRNKLGML